MGAYNLSDPIQGFEGPSPYYTFIGQKMKDQGYKTAMVGKWGIGGIQIFVLHIKHSNYIIFISTSCNS